MNIPVLGKEWAKPLAVTLLSVMVAIGCASSGSTVDPQSASGSTVARSVAVAPGVLLHCLDFGGIGDPLVLLAGAGNSAHIFEWFGPLLTDHFRVIAITRRGHGQSSMPPTGYDTATLAEDLRNVLDAFGFEKAHILGHSMAGAEMTRFACTYPERVLKLVYLDAAYDWAYQAEHMALLPPPPAQPLPNRSDLRSPAAYAAYWARMTGVPVYPETDIRATNRFSKSGRYRGFVTSEAIGIAIETGVTAEHPDYAAVRAPILAIYSVASSVEDLFPWLTSDSPQRQEAMAFWIAAAEMLSTVRDKFRTEAPTSKIIEMSAPHFAFLIDAETVANYVRGFLLEPFPGPGIY